MGKTLKKKSTGAASVNGRLLRSPMRKWSWLFMGPTVLAFFIGFIWPFIRGFGLSFTKFRTTSDAKFLGFGHLFDNYIRAFKDPSFVHAFWYTALFTVVSVVLINVLAFAVAYALTRGIHGNNLFRTVFFMPNLIGGIVLGYIWSMIFDGILTHLNTSIMLETKYGFWGLIILMCWQQVGYMMIIYIAGLQAIPEDMLEAAKIDGAGGWQTLWRVTIPNVMSSITICVFLTLSNGFKLFDQNLALTAGQPFRFKADGSTVKTTEMLALNIYNTFYGQNTSARGTAQAKAVLFFILVAALGLIQLKVTRKREVQQ
ncbi:MAG TPA: ABC transporter permease [Sphaerochaeta sp.]|jgi:raffinose/stachyose/melibiose transport system permease protein|nr:ABC transporter permease [Sphaerochaeta sp.]